MNRRENRKPRQGDKHAVRHSRNRSERTTVLIVCEGRETEPNYFNDLKREAVVVRRFDIKVLEGQGGSRQQIVQLAIGQKNRPDGDFDQVWCVMDTEGLNNRETRRDFRNALTLAVNHGIMLALSNPAFEVWLLAHFVRTSRSFQDCDAVIVELNKRWKTHFSRNYTKNDPRNFALLADLIDAGLENARLVREQDHPGKSDIADCNSSTEVYKLVGHLISS